tara:strand:+ start:885 stop:1199 length:315 start_codon:yes stop_codon:yes gene_type:complete
MVLQKSVNGVMIDLTAEEITEYNDRQTAWNNDSANRKLKGIKELRQQKLEETDWWVLRGDITDEQKAWRQGLRDIPQNYTTEAEYDLILARDEQGQLTHAVWSK